MTKIALVIPWRPQPDRIDLLKIVLSWYEIYFPEIEIFYSDRPGEYWNCSGSRNDGVKMAQEKGYDVIIINDADTIPEIEPLSKAIVACQKDGMVHNPYSKCKVFDKELTETIFPILELKKFEKLMEIFPHQISSLSNGGIYVTTPEAWWSVGGMDEKFIQWGWEDSAFEIAHLVIKGVKLIKHNGFICSLSSHKLQSQDEGYNVNFNNNTRLHEKYLLIKNPEEMLEFVKS